MKLRLLTLGKLRNASFRDGVEEYLKRLRRYAAVEWVEIPTRKSPPQLREADRSRILAAEAENIFAEIPKDFRLIVLDERGSSLRSQEFAEKIALYQRQSLKGLCFAIGSAHGLHEDCRKKAILTLSLSSMTLPHEMTLLLLSEQLYRAYTILKGEPYHKE